MMNWSIAAFYPLEKKEDIFKMEKALNAFFQEENYGLKCRSFYESDGSWFVYVDGENYESEDERFRGILHFIAKNYPDCVCVGSWDNDDIGETEFCFVNDGKIDSAATWENKSVGKVANPLLKKGNPGKYAILYLLGHTPYIPPEFRDVKGLESLECWDALEDGAIYGDEIEEIVRRHWGLGR